MGSDYVELADGGFLLFAVLVRPLPSGGAGQDCTVLGLSAVRLRRPAVGRVPVFVRDGDPGLVGPGSLGPHVVDAEPHLLSGADALPDVVPELVVVVGGRGRSQDAPHVVAVLAGGMVGLSHRVSQVALTVDLQAF